ncbi:MAG: sensor histidine kinase [Candidatus Rokuibacteriota bacterium]
MLLAHLLETGRLLATAPLGTDLLVTVAERAARVREGAICTLRVVQPGSAGLNVAACAGPVVASAAAALDADLPPLVLRRGRAVLVRDARVNSRVRCGALWQERGYAAWLGTPLPGAGAPVGVLGLALPAGARPPGRQERAVLDAYATQAALVLRAERLAATADRHARALEVARAELLEAAKLLPLGHLVSDVVHEASNVLGTVMLRMESLLEEPGGAQTGAQLHTLGAHCRQVGDLLNELRRFWGGGGARAVVSLDALVERLLHLRAPRMRARGMRVERVLAGQLPAVVADGVQLERAVLGVVLEAETAVRSQGLVRLTTGARRDSAGSWVTLAVEDDGPPIPADVLPHVFDPFAPRSQGRGPSVGLAAAHATVAAHGGRLTAANRPHGGVTFLIELPAAQ